MKRPSSWMWKHVVNEHNSDPSNITFSWKVTKKCNKPLQRQLCEAVKINRKKKDENLNTKYEYHGQRLRKLEVNHDKFHDCKTCGQLFSKFNDMKNHKELFHVNIKCEEKECDVVYFGTSGLKEHMKNIHR